MADTWQVEVVESDTLGGIATAAQTTLRTTFDLSPLAHIQLSETEGSSGHYALYLLFYGEEAGL